MTFPEPSQLVVQAGAIGQGGEVFILDMGKPVRILDLAHEMIRSAGLRVGHDIELKISGVRPGEKLYEELACDNEQTRPTAHRKIRVWQLATASSEEIQRMFERLIRVIDSPREDIIGALADCVPEYMPDGMFRNAPATGSLRLVLDDGEAAAA